jgi:inorganic pyrophosphatase/exopolyphosphatase
MARIKLYDVLNAKIKGLMLSPLPSDTLMMQHVLKD